MPVYIITLILEAWFGKYGRAIALPYWWLPVVYFTEAVNQRLVDQLVIHWRYDWTWINISVKSQLITRWDTELTSPVSSSAAHRGGVGGVGGGGGGGGGGGCTLMYSNSSYSFVNIWPVRLWYTHCNLITVHTGVYTFDGLELNKYDGPYETKLRSIHTNHHTSIVKYSSRSGLRSIW